ncbi:hypothetical protein AUI46_00465 [archaeon 13_1_40CM_2_52_13]|nr:MAG: hypothetical protein AUI46_00465 [archaeon 13_1_40CM_2_52_13]
MQTHRYKARQQAPSYFVGRVIVETLKHTKGDGMLSVSQIADQARTTTEQVALILGPLLRLEDLSGARLTNLARFKLAFEAVRHGALQQVARALTWQEFEAFTEECLQAVGFDTQKGIIVKGGSRRWQIDVIAKKSQMILAIDCKHWESPGYESRLSNAAEHQKLAVQALIQQMATREQFGRERVLALPMILTLFEPRSRMVDGVVVLSVEQLADFLEGVSPFSSELPFIPAQRVARTSIS